MVTDARFVPSLKLKIIVNTLPDLVGEDLVELKRKVEEEIEKRQGKR